MISRRDILRLLGIAPAAPVIAKAMAKPEPPKEPEAKLPSVRPPKRKWLEVSLTVRADLAMRSMPTRFWDGVLIRLVGDDWGWWMPFAGASPLMHMSTAVRRVEHGIDLFDLDAREVKLIEPPYQAWDIRREDCVNWSVSVMHEPEPWGWETDD